MNQRYTFLIIPSGKRQSKRFSMSTRMVKLMTFSGFLALGVLAFVITDYIKLRELRKNYMALHQENKLIKGEARILMSHLQDVKTSLVKVKEYTTKLGEITNLQTSNLAKKTGISVQRSLTQETSEDSTNFADIESEKSPGESSAKADQNRELLESSVRGHQTETVPSGISFEKLVFRPVFLRLNAVTMAATNSAFDLQNLIASLSQQKTLLTSVPTITPVDGWVTSGFGVRMSPFTGERSYHKGIDVAAPIGTAIFAPADGVVAYSGHKEGFGNFVMIAHGYGIVTGYGHNAQNLVSLGQVVKRGEQIATVGQSGRSTGPHVHYEVWVNGKVVDPKRFILNPSDISLNLVAH